MNGSAAADAGDRPAVLGGSPVFASALPFLRPSLAPIQDLLPGLERLWTGGTLTNHGPVEQAFARALASRLGAAVACAASGTTALMVACRALGLRGEVLLPALTFTATGLAPLWAGCRLRFVEVRAEDGTLDPAACAAAIGPQTEAILAVHLFGNPCDRPALEALAQRHGLALIFDAAHAFGSRYADGRPVGQGGGLEAFSFHATKVLPLGEGGAVAGLAPDLVAKAAELLNFGQASRQEGSRRLGLNGKMQEWNALVGLAALPLVDDWIRRRLDLLAAYRRGLSPMPGIDLLSPQGGSRSNGQYLALRVDAAGFGLDAGQLATALTAEGVPTQRYFSVPLHRQEVFAAASAAPLTVTETLASQLLCLPLYPDLAADHVEAVCRAIQRIHRHGRQVRLAGSR